MKNKSELEHHIQWNINSSSYYFWWDDWLGVGPLANFRNISRRLNNTKVFAFIQDGKWNKELIRNNVPPQYVDVILSIPL